LALTQELTLAVAQKLGRIHGLLTSSGSAALIIALQSAKIPRGPEIIMPAICCPAVLFAIQLAGYTPVLADVCLNDFCMNADEAEKLISERTMAIVAVHGYGHYCQIDGLEALARDRKLLLVEDACLAMGGTFKGRPLGGFGDISVVSFGYDKIINCNYGGALITDREDLFDEAKNIVDKNDFFLFNMHSDLYDEITEKLLNLDASVTKRIENTKFCHDSLVGDNIVKLPFLEDVIFWRLPVIVKSHRDEMVEAARKQGIIITSHYKSLHQLSTGIFLKNAAYVSDHIINIFVRPETPRQQISDIINFVNEFQNDYRPQKSL